MSRSAHALKLLVVNGISAAYWMPKRWRRRLLRRCGHDIGDAIIFSGSIIRTSKLTVGDGSFINHHCLFDVGEITIGRNVFVSSGVTLASNDHLVGRSTKRAGAEVLRPIVVEDGAWLGADVVVLGGVTVARGCIVGAGAVVTRSTTPDGVYAGVPARRIRDLAPSGDDLLEGDAAATNG